MLSDPGANRTIVANFFTSSYRLVGKVQVANSGLIGLLNDPTTEFLRVEDVSTARIQQPKKLAERANLLRLVKQSLVAVTLGHRTDIGPQSMARGGFKTAVRYPIRFVTHSFEIEGTLEWAGRLDLKVLLSDGPEFFVLYDTKLRAVEFSDLFIESPALLLSRRKVDMITML